MFHDVQKISPDIEKSKPRKLLRFLKIANRPRKIRPDSKIFRQRQKKKQAGPKDSHPCRQTLTIDFKALGPPKKIWPVPSVSPADIKILT